jgi:structural maintenance of chromosome 4
MDEIDAALDFRNVSIVANYVLSQARGAQFIIISLRNNMYELAHQLVGICKVRDVTRSVVLNPSLFEKAIISKVAFSRRQRQREEAGAYDVDSAERPKRKAEILS